MSTLREVDPEVADIIAAENRRQHIDKTDGLLDDRPTDGGGKDDIENRLGRRRTLTGGPGDIHRLGG